jgi:hypothetical protein
MTAMCAMAEIPEAIADGVLRGGEEGCLFMMIYLNSKKTFLFLTISVGLSRHVPLPPRGYLKLPLGYLQKVTNSLGTLTRKYFRFQICG